MIRPRHHHLDYTGGIICQPGKAANPLFLLDFFSKLM